MKLKQKEEIEIWFQDMQQDICHISVLLTSLTLHSILTIKLASSIFFSTSLIVLFLSSETENVLYGLDLKCSNHAIVASTIWLLPPDNFGIL